MRGNYGLNISDIMRHLWSPVCVVTSAWQGKINGQIAVTIGSASIVPDKPRLLIQIYKNNYSHKLIYSSGVFAANFLNQDQVSLIPTFGFETGKETNKFQNIAYEEGITGCPVLLDSWGFIEAKIVNSMDGGDMTCFLGEVISGEIVGKQGPLLWPDARRVLPEHLQNIWESKRCEQTNISMDTMGCIDAHEWNDRKVIE